MSLDHAILGFLSYGPKTGYELKKLFNQSVRHFWPVQQSQLYRTLLRLADEGFATREVVAQERRPNRKLYHITEEGRAEFSRWMSEPATEVPSRSPFLIQLFFAGRMEKDEARCLLHQKADEVRELLQMYEHGSKRSPREAEEIDANDQFYWFLTLDYGIEALRFSLRWLEEAIERIEAGRSSDGKDGALRHRRSS